MKNVKDDRGFNQVWAESESTRIRAERRCDYMLSLMDLKSDISIMEIGCGVGTNAHLMAMKSGKKILGTDLCVPFIEEAKKKFVLPGLRYEVLDFNKAADFKGETFNYIIGNGILHHLYHHLDEVFINMMRLLKAGGKIIFLEPNIYNPYCAVIFNFARKWAHLEPDEMAFSKSFITNKLKKAGFKNISVEYKDFLLPGIPPMLVQPSIHIGNVIEKIPIMKMVSQSIYISAER